MTVDRAVLKGEDRSATALAEAIAAGIYELLHKQGEVVAEVKVRREQGVVMAWGSKVRNPFA